MKRYWDFTEKQRANMAREQVDALLDFELMEAGIVKVDPPVFQPIEKIEVDRISIFEIKYEAPTSYGSTSLKLAFRNAEDAAAFIALNPLLIDSKYEYGQTNFAVDAAYSIEPKEYPPFSSAVKLAAKLKANEAAKSENERLQSAYLKECKIVDDATKNVWDDWHECRARQEKYQRIINTRTDYIRLSEGNESVADSFLKKAFPQPDIAAAYEWFDIEIEETEEVTA
jgi:hypothetical protein